MFLIKIIEVLAKDPNGYSLKFSSERNDKATQ